MGEGRARTTSSPPRSSELAGHERHRQLRPPVQQRPRRRAEARAAAAAALGRRTDPGRHRQRVRPRPAAGGAERPRPRRGADHLDVAAPADQQNSMGQRTTATRCPRRLTATRRRSPPGDYGPVPALTSALLNLADSGGLDGALQRARPVLRQPTTPSRCCSWLTARTWRTRLSASTWRRPVGDDERDRELPRSGLAVALHVLVPDQPFSTSGNADALVWGLMTLLTLLLALLPFIPGLRSIPRSSPCTGSSGATTTAARTEPEPGARAARRTGQDGDV